jgi:PAS domain S-box-containing protein/putative nucleotidyltransferase with HDIG domain
LNFERLKAVQIKDISLLDEKGTVSYSTTAVIMGENYSQDNFFSWAREPVNTGTVWIGYEKADRRRIPVTAGNPASTHIGIFLLTPLYRESTTGGRQKPGGKFAGALMFKVDLEEMLADRSLLFTPLMKLHKLWIMDKDGTVLLQSEHPEMLMRNIREKDETCNQCHASFDHVETMLGKVEGATEYQIKGEKKKVAAFASMSFANASWIVVVNAPLDEVTAFVWKNLIETLLLLAILVFVLGIAFFLAYRNYREKVDHETVINTLLSISLLNINLEEQLAKMFEIIISLPWLKVEAKGCIFLVKEKSDVLAMVVQKGLAPSLVTICAEVPFGRCICGRAALTGEIEFANSVDERHDNLYEGVSPHGHYCVPIKFHDKVLGVLNLCLRAGHRRDNREEEFLKAITDVMAGIIERKRAEENIRKSEEKFHSIVENATEGIYQATAAGHYLIMNKAFVNMLGYSSKEECIETITDIAHQIYVHPEKRMELIKIVDEHGVARGFETEFYKKDGSRFWVSINMQSVRDDRGQLLYYQGICEDITLKKRMEEERQQGVDRLRKALGGTIRAIALMVETRDPYTAGHQRRVADLARTIATEMGLESDRIEGLRIAGMIHDIGKIAVPAEILSKPTKLTEIEFSLIKNHVQAGYDILKDIEFPWPVARIVHEHHEKIDGSGYPCNLSGQETLIESKILTIADVVEAMASHRPYRPGLGLDVALDEIAKNKGIRYDPDVVDVCLKLFNEKGYKIID